MEDYLPTPRGLSEPRYKDSPINLFFEDLILDVLGQLPPGDAEKLQAMDLQRVFNTKASDWREVVREVLHLSDTIEVAIWDLWLRNRENLRREGLNLHPLAFSQDFVDHYFADDSKVDVWTPATLEAARKRIAGHRIKKSS